jgi:pimeloyl-ACP methyl ester carboxylesterase
MQSSTDTHCLQLSSATIDYDDRGSGPVLLFVHGVFVNGGLWREVVRRLEPRFRCIVPTWPLGAHREPRPDGADRSPRGIARLIVEFMERLDLHDVTLVGNDTGGALCQLVIAHQPERVGALVLTNCDAFEAFPPRPLAPLYAAANIPGFFLALAQLLRPSIVQRLFWATVSRSRPDPDILASSLTPLITNSRVRGDVLAAIRMASKRDTLAASRSFASFDRPVLIAWATDDLFFPLALGRRLAEAFPRSRFEPIAGSRTFVPADQPAKLAALLEAFVGAPASV